MINFIVLFRASLKSPSFWQAVVVEPLKRQQLLSTGMTSKVLLQSFRRPFKSTLFPSTCA